MQKNSSKSNEEMKLIKDIAVGIGVIISIIAMGLSHYFGIKLRISLSSALWILVVVFGGLLFYAVWVGISSSLKTQKASTIDDRRAKEFIPLENVGIVYIFRDQSYGRLHAFPVSVSGKTIGSIKGNTFIRLILPAGVYRLGGNKACQTETTVNILNGQIVFVEQQIIMGMLRTHYIYKVVGDFADVRDRVRQCRLLKRSTK